MQVFEIVRAWADEFVTVFADSFEEARSIYLEWIDAHHADRPHRPITIYPFGEAELEDRPVLATAAKRNAAGVGYWCRTKERWVVAHPHARPTGDLVEPEPRVAYYLFDAEDGEEALVFAESVEQAVTLYCAYQLDRWGELPARYSFRKRSRWDLRGELATLRDGMQADMSGVAFLDEHGVWRILPPDWEGPLLGSERREGRDLPSR